MNIVIDQGNSFAKVGIFEGQNLMQKHIFSASWELKDFLAGSVFDNALYSSVSKGPEIFVDNLRVKNKRFILSHTLPTPVALKYENPHTLGVDRLAAVCGALQLFPDEDCLIIDCGTCITYDVLLSSGAYAGGSISPGLRMKFKALNTFTERLPLLEPGEFKLPGLNTEESIRSGVIMGTVFEIESFIANYKALFSPLRVLLCGGDASFFEKQLKEPIFVAPDLVLIGLNRILLHNVE